MRYRLTALAVSFLTALTVQPGAVAAQLPPILPGGRIIATPPRGGFGYTATLPDSFLGAGGFYMFGESRAWGAFGAVQTKAGSIRGEPGFLEDETVASILAFPFPPGADVDEFGRTEEWLVTGFGVVRSVTPMVAFYAGGGPARRRNFRRYHDPDGVIRAGFFSVEDAERTGWTANVSIGTLVRMGEQLVVLAGYQTAARSLSLGVFFVTP